MASKTVEIESRAIISLCHPFLLRGPHVHNGQAPLPFIGLEHLLGFRAESRCGVGHRERAEVPHAVEREVVGIVEVVRIAVRSAGRGHDVIAVEDPTDVLPGVVLRIAMT